MVVRKYDSSRTLLLHSALVEWVRGLRVKISRILKAVAHLVFVTQENTSSFLLFLLFAAGNLQNELSWPSSVCSSINTGCETWRKNAHVQLHPEALVLYKKLRACGACLLRCWKKTAYIRNVTYVFESPSVYIIVLQTPSSHGSPSYLSEDKLFSFLRSCST